MTTTLPQPLSCEMPSTSSQLIAAVLEPLYVVISCLFWAVALPISGLFCIGVAICDYVNTLSTKEVRLPDLRSGLPNPLVLRRSAKPAIESTRPASAASHAAQA